MTKAFLVTVLLFFFCSAMAQTINRYEVVISEIMADPTPQVGLPASEWIELKNTSSTAINLQGWRVGDASSLSGPMPSFVLQPDSFVMVTTSGAVAALSAFGRVISVTSFPSLDNDGDRIILQNAQGRIIHAVEYKNSWYQNDIKADGGWSLEMIDTKNPCMGMSNWKASVDPSGGTPGKKNSVDGVNADNTPPLLLRTFSVDSMTLIAVFNEPLDSVSASIAANYALSNNISIVSAVAQPPFFSTVVIKLATPLQRRTVYTLTVSNVKDCTGNIIGSANKTKAGVAENVQPQDLVINEILFNPKPSGNDYVEVYNRSNKIIDAGKMIIATRNSSGALTSFKSFSDVPFFIFPEDYVVLTANAESLQKQYFVPNPQQVLTVSLPSLPDDKGTVVIADMQGSVVDEVTYADNWHFPLLSNTEGVALERVDANAASQNANNWHSAASTVGYGTPTYKNSQARQAQSITGTVETTPKVFSPDNDGIDDIALIQYQLQQPNFVANITIFDASGKPVRHLVKNALLGTKGSWTWDGLGEKNQKLPMGVYVIFTEIFNVAGKKQQFKNTIVLARRF